MLVINNFDGNYNFYSKKSRYSMGKRCCRLSGNGLSQQRGLTLLIGLILMAMLMVISVIGFRNVTQSERMTGNSVDRNTSFQSAENAGKEAIAIIENGGFTAAAIAATVGYYATPIPQGGNSEFWTKGAGTAISANACATTTPFVWTSCSATVPTKYTNNNENAQFAIELLSAVSSGSSTVSTYRISSRSTGGSGNAEVVLQSIYSRTTTP